MEKQVQGADLPGDLILMSCDLERLIILKRKAGFSKDLQMLFMGCM